ncbi:serine/threonine protein kinase [Rhodococcus fascians]|jgi:serine/threonine protein kinase|nr:serine/threonine protein kinase [Rhodococcus fascians]MBY3825498.1 serine/threonine protein kinase [Rhodococcus fascians]MBY3835960.1 serine/threonine protein kinase [Rhodococcus fascians]MBY3865172.1 serine/threonine protein kinase [Rhodococcus fascians]MBY3884426.1 serine/threonine protein kinase [Rhodococcus fascians]
MTTSHKYTLLNKLGEGGQGDVWEAVAPTLEQVAYKVFRPDPTSLHVDNERARFLKEIRTQTKLTHPNIVPVIEDGIDTAGNPFYVMEWADGSLQDVIDKNPGGVKRHLTLYIFEAITRAMAYAHEQQVLHRDLKPQNVLIYQGVPRVADFGLGRDLTTKSATYTQSHLGWGSLGYMAPEQMQSLHSATEPADVYALGRILYAMVTGLNPFQDFDVAKAPSDVQYLILKCTDTDPARRYKNASDLHAAVVKLMSADPLALAPPAEQASAALSAMTTDSSALELLVQVLISNPQDSQLYSTFLPKLPNSVIVKIAKLHPVEFRTIMRNFDVYAEGSQPFDYCDVIADFLAPCFKATQDLEVRRSILERLLILGSYHGRWHVGIVFADLCDTVLTQAVYSQMIEDVLRTDKQDAKFVKEYLERYSLPQNIREVLDQD